MCIRASVLGSPSLLPEIDAVSGCVPGPIALEGTGSRTLAAPPESKRTGRAARVSSPERTSTLTLSARAPDAERVAYALSELARAGIDVAEFSLGQPTLDEVFLELTGHPADATTAEEYAA